MTVKDNGICRRNGVKYIKRVYSRKNNNFSMACYKNEKICYHMKLTIKGTGASRKSSIFPGRICKDQWHKKQNNNYSRFVSMY